jgi:hypothetical protein
MSYPCQFLVNHTCSREKAAVLKEVNRGNARINVEKNGLFTGMQKKIFHAVN